MIAAVAVNLIGVLALFLTGAMSVQIARSFGLAAPAVGTLAALFALSTMLGSAPLGGRVGQWGVRRSLWIASGISAVSLILCALSPSVTVLGAALLLSGAGNALGQPAGNALVAAQVNPARFGLGFAIKQSGIPVATLLGGLAVPLIALTVGWRFAFAAAAVAALVAAALVPPDRTGRQVRAEEAVPTGQRRTLWTLAVGLIFAVVAATSIGALGAAGAVAVGWSEAAAGYLVALGGAAGLAIRLSAGVVADRRWFDTLRAVSWLCLMGAAGWFVMGLDAPWPFALGLVVANAFGWGSPGLQHLSMARRFPSATAAASGVAQTGVAAGLFLGPAILGLIATTAGWRWTWIAAGAAALLATVIIRLAAARIPDASPPGWVNPSPGG